jgi:hypothetical protein
MKKAPIAVALVLVFGLFAAAFSLSPVLAQNATNGTSTNTTTTTTTNTTSTGNATTTNATTTGGATFSASGSIASLIFPVEETSTSSSANETMSNDTSSSTSNNMTSSGNMTTMPDNSTGAESNTTTVMSQTITGNASISTNATSPVGNMTTNTTGTASTDNATSTDTMNDTTTTTTTASDGTDIPYVLSGDWSIDVQDGNVSSFEASFDMVHTDGTMRHMHELTNFQASNFTSIELSDDGSAFIFGTVDVMTNGEEAWTGASVLVMIENYNVVTIALDSETTEGHFHGQPIYGITDSFTDENGQEQIQTQTSSAGSTTNETSGNMTDAGSNIANETGEFFGNVSEGVQDIFNGTG